MSTTISEMEKQVIRERMAVCSQVMRQEAISLFIISVAQTAADLRKLCEAARYLPLDVGTARDAVAVMDHLERLIREEFVKTFGHDMIAVSASGEKHPSPITERDATGDGRPMSSRSNTAEPEAEQPGDLFARG